MNRLILIGNGFDLAHGLKTKYEHFIDWYWGKKLRQMALCYSPVCEDLLCKFEIISGDSRIWQNIYFENHIRWKDIKPSDIIFAIIEEKERFSVGYAPFFSNILRSIETKGWVDIENEYYRLLEYNTIEHHYEKEVAKLNKQLQYLQELLTEYLITISQQDIRLNDIIKKKIYEPIKSSDISIEASTKLKDHIEWCKEQDNKVWELKFYNYGINGFRTGEIYDVDKFKDSPTDCSEYPRAYMLPENIMLLDFNYTKTVQVYLIKDKDIFSHIYIHGQLEKPKEIIFGYGDEFDDKYKKLQALNNNECLTNIKTIRYQESDNYRKVLHFIESAPFQVCIMGHSCGNSDRTLLNTIFEHRNCISIKPYYYKKEDGTDNYIELIQNISRNFKDMKLMRDRVVNKLYCEALTE